MHVCVYVCVCVCVIQLSEDNGRHLVAFQVTTPAVASSKKRVDKLANVPRLRPLEDDCNEAGSYATGFGADINGEDTIDFNLSDIEDDNSHAVVGGQEDDVIDLTFSQPPAASKSAVSRKRKAVIMESESEEDTQGGDRSLRSTGNAGKSADQPPGTYALGMFTLACC